jgi:hypothetical protein
MTQKTLVLSRESARFNRKNSTADAFFAEFSKPEFVTPFRNLPASIARVLL